MADRIKGITIEIDGNTTKLSEALKKANSTLKDTQSSLKDVNRLLKIDPGNVTLLKQKQDLLKTSIAATKDKLKETKDAYEQLKKADPSEENKQQMQALEREIADTTNSLKYLEKQAKDFGSVFKQQMQVAGDKVQDLGSGIKDVGASMSKNVTAPIVGVGAAAIAAFKEVDAGFDIVRAKTGATGQNLKEMEGMVTNIASQIPTSFDIAGAAVGEVNTRFGLTGQALEDLSTKFIKFAKINQLDVSSSIDETQKALSAFGLGSASAGTLLDRLNLVGQQTGASMDALLSGLIQNGTAFQEMGLNIEQSVSLMGQLETSGANSETVMNGLRKALKNAVQDGIPLNQALEDLQQTILGQKEGIDGLKASYDLFGKSGDQIYGAVKNGTLNFSDLGAAIADAGGNLDNTFEGMQDPIDKFNVMMNKAKVVGSELGGTLMELLLPILEKLSNFLMGLKNAWESLDPGMQKVIITIALIIAAVGPLLVIVGNAIVLFGNVIAVLGAVASPVGIVIAAIAALIAIGVALAANWDTICNITRDIWSKISGAVTDARNAIGNAWSGVVDWFGDKWSGIKNGASDIWSGIVGIFTGAVDTIKGLFNFEFRWPHIPLPHFSISGSLNPLDWLKGGLPKIGVNWYAKAMQQPLLLSGATIFGSMGDKLLGGGEAGREVVLSEAKLKELAGGGQVTNYITIQTLPGQDNNAIANMVIEKIRKEMQRGR